MEFLVGILSSYFVFLHFISFRIVSFLCFGFCKIIYRLNCCLEVFVCMYVLGLIPHIFPLPNFTILALLALLASSS